MTLAVMTRATRGHSGQALHAPLSTVLAIYAPVMAAAFARVASALMPEQTMLLLPLAGVCWSVAFLGFALLYGRMLLGNGQWQAPGGKPFMARVDFLPVRLEVS